MSIHLDIATDTVLVYCDDCPPWAELRLSREEAELAGMAHEERCHPESYTFQNRVLSRARMSALRVRRHGGVTGDPETENHQPVTRGRP